MIRFLWDSLVYARTSAALLLPVVALGCGDAGDDTFGDEAAYEEAAPVEAPPMAETSFNPDASALEINLAFFTPVKCKHVTADNSTTVCGYVPILFDHTKPNDHSPENVISIYVTIFKPTKGDYLSKPPRIFLTGGPGSPTKEANDLFENASGNAYAAELRASFVGDQRLVVVDQRGTNYSGPFGLSGLYCDVELGAGRSLAYGKTLVNVMKLRLSLVAACRNRLVKSGVNLNLINTFQSAHDVVTMLNPLRATKLSLFGASYGTRLTMTTMKLFPSKIESAVIDSVVPPEVNVFEMQPEGAAYALSSLWQAAAVDFPMLKKAYYGTIASLEAAPAKVTIKPQNLKQGWPSSVLVTGVEYVAYVMGKLRDSPVNVTLPSRITAMAMTKDYEDVAIAHLNSIDFLFPDGGAGTSAMAVGMHESVNGAQDAHPSYTSIATIEKNILSWFDTESERELARQNFIEQSAALRGKWPVNAVPPSMLDPLVSGIPTLMMVGELDSGTPAPFSFGSFTNLSNSFYLELMAGHAVTYMPCAAELMNDFFMAPSVKPDATKCSRDVAWTKP